METNSRLDLGKIRDYQRDFVREREWEQFHTPKNLAMALAGEVGELVEVLQWLTEEQSRQIMKDGQKGPAMRHEIADILYYLVRLADVLDVDIDSAFWEKARLNEKKYPVNLSKGHAKKYTEF